MMQFAKGLITGATSGIGEALAHLISKKGISLLLTGRNEQKLQSLQHDLEGKVSILPADLSTKEGQNRLLAWIESETPDLCIFNAGFGLYGRALDLPLQAQLAILEVNTASVFAATLTAAKALQKAHKKGVIVNVSSIAGELPTPGMAIYGASKAAVTSFSLALDKELEKEGIRVLASCPGQVETDFAKRAAKKSISRSKGVMSSTFAAQQIWGQVLRQKRKHTFDFASKIQTQIAKHFLPTSFTNQLIWDNIQKRL